MTLYTIDFGFNLNAAPIGTIVQNPIPQLPLQLNMVDERTGRPAWPTQLRAKDEIRYRVTDITSKADETPDDVADTWSSSGPVQGYVPTSLKVAISDPVLNLAGGGGAPSRLLEFGESHFAFQSEGPPQSAVYNAANSDWKLAIWYVGASTTAGGRRFEIQDTSAFYKMSAALEMENPAGGIPKTFIIDPEMFVGGGDEGN